MKTTKRAKRSRKLYYQIELSESSNQEEVKFIQGGEFIDEDQQEDSLFDFLTDE